MALCYRGRAYCGSDCANTSCSRFVSPDIAVAAARLDLPIAYSDFSPKCPDYVARLPARRHPPRILLPYREGTLTGPFDTPTQEPNHEPLRHAFPSLVIHLLVAQAQGRMARRTPARNRLRARPPPPRDRRPLRLATAAATSFGTTPPAPSGRAAYGDTGASVTRLSPEPDAVLHALQAARRRHGQHRFGRHLGRCGCVELVEWRLVRNLFRWIVRQRVERKLRLNAFRNTASL